MADGLTRDYTIAYNVDGTEATKSRYLYQYAEGAAPTDRDMAGIAIYSIQEEHEILVSMQITNICALDPPDSNTTEFEKYLMRYSLLSLESRLDELRNDLGKIPGGEAVTLLSLQIAYAPASGEDLANGFVAGPYIASYQCHSYVAGTTLLQKAETYSLNRGLYRKTEESTYYSSTADIARYGKNAVKDTRSYGWDMTTGTAFVYQEYTRYLYHADSAYSGSYKLYKEYTVNTENGNFYFSGEVFYNTDNEYISTCNAGGANCYRASEYGHLVVRRLSYTPMFDEVLKTLNQNYWHASTVGGVTQYYSVHQNTAMYVYDNKTHAKIREDYYERIYPTPDTTNDILVSRRHFYADGTDATEYINYETSSLNDTDLAMNAAWLNSQGTTPNATTDGVAVGEYLDLRATLHGTDAIGTHVPVGEEINGARYGVEVANGETLIFKMLILAPRAQNGALRLAVPVTEASPLQAVTPIFPLRFRLIIIPF